MSVTFIPDYAIIMVFFLGTFMYFGYLLYVVYLLFLKDDQFKKQEKSKQIITIIFLVISIGYMITYLVHGTQSGLYHDMNGSGPSDGEKNFHLIELAFAYLTLIMTQTTYK